MVGMSPSHRWGNINHVWDALKIGMFKGTESSLFTYTFS